MNLPTRRELAERWAAAWLQWPDWQSKAISSDASFRAYYRIQRQDRTLVIMDAPPERESVSAFIETGERLRRAGLHTPEILAGDIGQGFLLLEDLGREPFHEVLTEDNADALFADALRALQRIQSQADPTGLQPYDAGRLMQELALFPDWFLHHHWQVEPSDSELDDWDLLCAVLIRWALDQPQVFCHRDYMPRNLMLSTPNPGIIDFQDAVLGPISYDPVSLFRDAFLSWPTERVDAWLEAYRLQGLAAGLPLPESPELWRRTCDLMGVQRHLKVIGIFARIRYRDGKPKYLEEAPRFFAYLDLAISRNAELAPLARLIEAWRRRRRAPQ